MGLDWTYAQVRDHAQGNGCTRDADRLNVLMIACLQELWTIVYDDPFYSETQTFVLAPGEASIDISGCATISSVVSKYEDGQGVERCRTIRPGQPLPPRDCSCYVAKDEVCEHVVRGLPGEFEISGDTLTIRPVPEQEVSIEIQHQRELNCELFTLEGDTIIWNSVDLPERYQPALANLVLSKFYAEESDFNRSNYWEQRVRLGTSSLVEQRDNRYSEDSRQPRQNLPFELIRRGEDRHKSGCGCDPIHCRCAITFSQTKYVDRHIDCHGNVTYPEPHESVPEVVSSAKADQ